MFISMKFLLSFFYSNNFIKIFKDFVYTCNNIVLHNKDDIFHMHVLDVGDADNFHHDLRRLLNIIQYNTMHRKRWVV
jgi:hypothetical protein